MNKHLYFGEQVKGYEIPVLNEREARAGAGILLLPALTSFLISFLTHDFIFTKIFVTVFMLDFFIRLFINPKYAPSLILGRLFIQNQTPEYVGAPQKKFAWSIGFVLSVVMFVIIVILELMVPIKIAICILCIALLFSETAFGICLGCIIYHKIQKEDLRYCPGNVCQMKHKEKIQEISKLQILVLIGFFVALVCYSIFIIKQNSIEINTKPTMKCAVGKCGGNM